MKFLRDNQGLETTEIALAIGAIVLIVLGAFKLLGGSIQQLVTDAANKIAGH